VEGRGVGIDLVRDTSPHGLITLSHGHEQLREVCVEGAWDSTTAQFLTAFVMTIVVIFAFFFATYVVGLLILNELWLGAESNRRHEDFQSSALPTELPSLKLFVKIESFLEQTWVAV
jgi:hypothetical protein